jgi:hypothetical protein
MPSFGGGQSRVPGWNSGQSSIHAVPDFLGRLDTFSIALKIYRVPLLSVLTPSSAPTTAFVLVGLNIMYQSVKSSRQEVVEFLVLDGCLDIKFIRIVFLYGASRAWVVLPERNTRLHVDQELP